MRAKYIALTSTVKIELADGRGREAFCFPNTATISPPATGTGKSQKPFIFQIIEMYLNLVDMRRKIIYLWIPGDGNIVVD
jgi:hypothetical protein